MGNSFARIRKVSINTIEEITKRISVCEHDDGIARKLKTT